ncbi:MAG: SLC13 family permease [bacterium]|nr:SLC13 family permease [bacterium]
MTVDQGILFALIVGIFALLIWGKFRYDVVAFSALIVAYVAGVVPKEQVFTGFGHPAVVIIALVLVASRGLSRSGAIELLARRVIKASRGLQAHIGIVAAVSAALSSVMNNVAALALLMPLDIQTAQRAKRSPALTLMPLSFASILGGMVTLIGTPPNIVVATFRAGAIGEPYSMLDFAPVGGVVALVGIVFITTIGWRLIPHERTRHDAAKELEDVGDFVAELVVPETSSAVDKTLRELEPAAEECDVALLGIVRRGKRLPGTARSEELRKNDLVVLEGSPEEIDRFVGATGLGYVGSDKRSGLAAATIAVIEAVVPQGARIEGRSAMDIRLLSRQGVTLLGISRQGRRFRDRVRKVEVRAGDILLLLGTEEQLPDVVNWLGCHSLARGKSDVAQRNKAWLAAGVFAAAIAAASLGLLYLPLALGAVVVAYVLLRIVSLSDVYDSVEWPVIVLVGAMIPIGAALEASGGTALIAESIVRWTQGLPAIAVLTILMVVTMTLSDVLNNVATAVIAAPVGLDIAARLGANPDSFLMAVAVGASCAFLTPIGHKNNMIILGPGGYEFGDYWRMGLPLEALVVAVSVPMIALVWPL